MINIKIKFKKRLKTRLKPGAIQASVDGGLKVSKQAFKKGC